MWNNKPHARAYFIFPSLFIEGEKNHISRLHGGCGSIGHHATEPTTIDVPRAANWVVSHKPASCLCYRCCNHHEQEDLRNEKNNKDLENAIICHRLNSQRAVECTMQYCVQLYVCVWSKQILPLYRYHDMKLVLILINYIKTDYTNIEDLIGSKENRKVNIFSK